jgi:hypothetical protein
LCVGLAALEFSSNCEEREAIEESEAIGSRLAAYMAAKCKEKSTTTDISYAMMRSRSNSYWAPAPRARVQ